MEKNFISVIMPSYNSEEFIELAIQSVLEQTFTNIELIVIDDASSDNTTNIIKNMAEKDSRVCFIQNEKNMGVAYTRNKGFDLSRGEYVALLDSDDVWHPQKLEKQLILAKKFMADIVYCSYGIIDEFGKKRCNDFIVPSTTKLEDMFVKSVISCSTAMLSRDIVKKYHFPTEFYHEDYAMWLQLLKDGKKAVGEREVLAQYRVKSNSRAANKILSAKRRWDIYRLFMKMPRMKSLYYLVQYAFEGVIKYHKILK